MGLDMYLTKKVYIGANYEHRKIEGAISITQDGKPIPINFRKVSYIEEEAGYWRKANQIHQWFVDNVQGGNDDCRDYYVSPEKLEELLTLCERVLSASVLVDGEIHNGDTFRNGEWITNMESGKVIKDPTIASELLPTQRGFFFGGTDYDEYYLEDIQNTCAILKDALKDKDAEYYYHSSW